MEIQEKRKMGDMLKMPRDCARSLQRTHNVRYKGDLLKGAFFLWLADYFTTILRGKHPFPEYDLSDPRAGIHTMPNSVKVGLAGDWASGTVSAYRVRYEMEELDPDITIHLGDVYFAGKQEEFDEYFMGEDDWPRGSLQQSDRVTALASYALNGNHEMYSEGHAYFNSIMKHFGQEASFFCLENEHWRVVALDSGYSSRLIPVLELIPWWIHLHDHNMKWLKENILGTNDSRPIILLSHHQWFSSYDLEYNRFGRELGNDPRYLLWFWGHEHRLAAYGKYQAHPKGPRTRARCVGHGGMPIEDINTPVKRERNLVAHDRRSSGDVDGTDVGYCGFAFLEFENEALEISYRDETGMNLLTEIWIRTADGARGEVIHHEPELLTLERPIEDLVA